MLKNYLTIAIEYYLISSWFQDFAYRVDIHPGLFLAGGLTALVVALFIVSVQAFRTVVINPAESLRSE